MDKIDGRELLHNVKPQTLSVLGIQIKTISFKVNVWTTVKQSYKFGLTAGLVTAGWEIGANVATTDTESILVKRDNIELSATFCSADGGVTWNPLKNENK